MSYRWKRSWQVVVSCCMIFQKKLPHTPGHFLGQKSSTYMQSMSTQIMSRKCPSQSMSTFLKSTSVCNTAIATSDCPRTFILNDSHAFAWHILRAPNGSIGDSGSSNTWQTLNSLENALTRKHNTPRGAALPGERTTAWTAFHVFTGMCINIPCHKNKREVARARFELATL